MRKCASRQRKLRQFSRKFSQKLLQKQKQNENENEYYLKFRKFSRKFADFRLIFTVPIKKFIHPPAGTENNEIR